MAFESGTAYPESDADDEYERSVHNSSPVLANDSDADSDGLSSSEHTPTTYGNHGFGDTLPEANITEWTADDCADFVGSLGLRQYGDQFLENEIVGEALVALQHDDLKQMGVTSVGHRLTILKNVYDIKIKQDVPIESDHYVPLSADAEAQYATATLKDIKNLVEQLRLRDERMSVAEMELRRLTAEYTRLREDLLPLLLLRHIKHDLTSCAYTIFESIGWWTIAEILNEKAVPGINAEECVPHIHAIKPRTVSYGTGSRSYERCRKSGVIFFTSECHEWWRSITISWSFTQSTVTNFSSFDGVYEWVHVGITTPARSTFPQNDADQYPQSTYSRDSTKPMPQRRAQTPALDTPSTGGSGGGASVEIFKSFRVSMEDPCYKVLPAALKKYNINAPWEQYALYIVYGDKERCLGMEEKPLILFKQLDKEGKKPMFMLRKISPNADPGADGPGSAGLDGRNGGRGPNSSVYDPPGGII
ncbi:kinase regulator ste50 protein [Rutstroemia sp. NJR-2017a BBW]|nr:kinase regulator ste50 protein [Rutstroemia sp. NJR-2017a BBW]